MAPGALSAVGLAVAVMAALCSWASAQSGCAPMMVNLIPCLSYITGSMSAPPADCCSQLDSIVQTQRECLCAVLVNGGSSFSIPVNQTLALSLPGACDVKAAPLSECYAAAVIPRASTPSTPSTLDNAPSPSGTPPTAVASSPSMQNAPSGSGSKTVSGSPVAGSAGRLRTHPLFFCLLIAVTGYASSVISF